jgi:hypothetical protein
MTGNLSFGDNNKVILGSGSDLQLYHDANNSFIKDSGTGSLYVQADAGVYITNASGSENKAIFTSDGAVNLYHDNALRFVTTSSGIDVTGVITTDGMTTSADINFGDNDKAVFGAGSDLQIYHDGSHSYIVDAGTGNMYLSTNGNGIVMQASLSETMFSALPNGSVRLYHDNSQKLETTSTGIDVTGSVTADGLTVNSGGDQEVYFGDNADGVALSNTGALSRLEFGGSQTTGGVAHFEYNRANGSTVFAQGTNGSETTRMQLANGGDISFYNSAGTSQDLYWDASSSRLGLGETNPSHELHIKSVSPQIRLEDSDGTNTYGDLKYNGVSLNIISRGGASSYGAITFARTDCTNTYNTAQINAAGDFRFYNDSGTAKMRWDANAEALGIGIETPAVRLQTNVANASTEAIRITNDADSVRTHILPGEFQAQNSDLTLNAVDGFATVFKTTNTERMRITSAGAIDVHGDSINAQTASSYYVRNRVNGGSLNLGVETSAGALYYPITMSGASNITVFRNATDEIARFLSNGNLGIGTDSAQSILEIQDANAQLTIDSELSQFSRVVHQHNGTSVWTTGTRSASDYHIFRESGSGNVIVDAGNVGINTASPYRTLTVAGDQVVEGLLEVTAATPQILFSVPSGGLDSRIHNDGSGNFIFGTGTNSLTPTERMRIESDGNLRVYDSIDNLTGTLTLNGRNTGQIRFESGGSLKMLMDSSGRMQVAKSSHAYTTVGVQLGTYSSNSIDNTTQFTHNNSGGASVVCVAPTSESLITFYRQDTGGFMGHIRNDSSNSVSYFTSSDERLKDNIVDAPSASDDIDAIQVRSFDWKADGSHQKYGVIAQELNNVIPSAVDMTQDENKHASVDYSKLVPMLVKEIQSLRARVAQLEGAN